MINSRPFNQCEALHYKMLVFEPQFMVTDLKDPLPDLIYINNKGFALYMEKGVCTLSMNKEAAARLLYDELIAVTIYDFEDLKEYFRFHNGKELELIQAAIDEATHGEPETLTFLNVIEHIVQTFKLNEAEIAQLKKSDDDYYSELNERTYK